MRDTTFALTRADVIAKLHDRVTDAGSQKAAAYHLNITEAQLSGMLRWMPPSKRVLEQLGLRAEVVYLPVEDISGSRSLPNGERPS